MNTSGKSAKSSQELRRAGGAVLDAGEAACAATALFGALPAQASVIDRAASVATSRAQVHLGADRRQQLRKAELARVENLLEAKSLGASYASGHNHGDAFDLLAMWDSADRNQSRPALGAALRTGQTDISRRDTTEQQIVAFRIAASGDNGLVGRVAERRDMTKRAAKAKASSSDFASQPIPQPLGVAPRRARVAERYRPFRGSGEFLYDRSGDTPSSHRAPVMVGRCTC